MINQRVLYGMEGFAAGIEDGLDRLLVLLLYSLGMVSKRAHETMVKMANSGSSKKLLPQGRFGYARCLGR